MFQNILFVGLAAIGLASCATLGGQANKSILVYYLQPEFLSNTKLRDVQEGDAILSQPVFLKPTVTINSDAVSLQGEVSKRNIHKGSILFNAASPRGTVFCSLASDAEDGQKQYRQFNSDIFCFLDTDKDNRFDEYFAIPGGGSLYPIFTTHRTPWSQLAEQIPYTHNGKDSKFPLEIVFSIKLESVRADKREIFVLREMGTTNSTGPVSFRQKLQVGADGTVNIDGAQFTITSFHKNSISVELNKPVPARAFTIGHSPSRTFYVPG